MSGFPYDAHVHTNVCEGRDSLAEVIRAAEAVELELVVVADSYEAAGDDLRDRIRAVVKADGAAHVMVVPGIETAILDAAGGIAIVKESARLAPVVYAHFGGRTHGIAHDPPASKQRYLDNIFNSVTGAVTNPAITALARPFNIGQFPAPLTPSQLPRSGLAEVAAAMAEAEVAFEISNRMHWWFPELSVDEFTREYTDLMSVFAARNVKFLVSSDARSSDAVGNLHYVLRLMREAGIERSQVIDLPQLVRRQTGRT